MSCENKIKTEFTNSGFVMDHGMNEINLNTNNKNTEQIKLKQIQPNFNKKLPVEYQLEEEDREEENGCKFIADKLGMDAERLKKFYSLSLALLATFSITSSIFLVKLSKTLSASDMALIKFAVQLVFCLPLAYFYRQDLLGPKGTRLLLVLRGLIGSLSIITAYFSIKMINFSDSIVIRYSSPLVTALFARFILKEKLSYVHLISFVLSLVGVLCIIRPSAIFRQFGQQKEVEKSWEFILGMSLAILGTILSGSNFVFIKKLINRNIHYVVIIFYFSLIGILTSASISAVLYLVNINNLAFSFTKQIVLKDVSIGLLAGLISFIGHVCFTLAISKYNANKIAIMRTADILIAFLLEYFVLSLVPNWFSLIGALLVLVSVLIIYIFKFIVEKRKLYKQKQENKNDQSNFLSTIKNDNNIFRI